MDNYEIAMTGVEIASKILGIKTPEVRFFVNDDINKKDINAVFLRNDNIIGFNETWLESVEWLEVMVTCFHESRHAFQHEVINNRYKGNIKIDSPTKELWVKETSEYKSKFTNSSDETYLMQDMEIDAIAFAHKMMLVHFEVKTIIPDIIKHRIENK
ncbi:MAG: hypothetical protein A2Y45_01325 [Tenericutes bacterium GWC2_34_14]|nr:MAG: hypothetical protein A2Z84_08360 [Tenericutes bacterium GWA2_35_7]OHE28180.1 MAG: hypothetical protein A2Y45_01325 [Tenericutes bacterium GWC2_34_14]OHE33194.1 MAG: hypothetical protein A2012_00755 [Tenericutes bacterium GWE2_34_108]OHE36314.1 MAG: hypothetical protein A2Y46_07745 [Tenericutes bacterium GWF1_35_14]OHE38644.1 MAG: hypothetical protein A2Y44_04485 [Tenericutes bacterium GWF2_35_184]OHE42409.1 MAG: hypothetical protein A3K26_09795 [Tenericutes bacterium RIFOXYA12_FULL_35_